MTDLVQSFPVLHGATAPSGEQGRVGQTLAEQTSGASAPSGVSPWIIHPVFDFFFVSGGGVLLFLALNALFFGLTIPNGASTPGQRFALIAVLLGQHFFADAHNMATYMRIWGSDADRTRFAFYRTWLVWITGGLFVSGLVFPDLIGTFVYVYLISVFWHYAAQTFGIALIYCFKRGYKLSQFEKETFRWFIRSLTAFVIIRFLTFESMSPKNWFGVPIPFWGPLPTPLYLAAGAAVIISSAILTFIVLKKLVFERRFPPVPAFLLVATICALGFTSGTANALVWFYVPAFFHGSQYLAVCMAYSLKERGIPARDLWKTLPTSLCGTYFATVVVTGAFFYIAIPHVFAQLGFDYALIAGLVLAAVNFHHFVTDAAIWKLRDPYCRRILVE
ncbi:MAG: hypothetical protein IT290_03670 [Deltaproteobacteria bacterium]|nr:hypothetical protein [Deltaproteobacteria bacterium]